MTPNVASFVAVLALLGLSACMAADRVILEDRPPHIYYVPPPVYARPPVYAPPPVVYWYAPRPPRAHGYGYGYGYGHRRSYGYRRW